ncbi:EEF1A lysine methyltransferase 2-like [Drosophila innubila]|uniref:EEF1A lysine methyltransferase 2-like n=1 Tax=Drosophila innubila TaxID=198719 RepID=UPI00148C70FA|nr:EEF1A lysine methyltransferase 2-like [Drosophila innubila]
MELDSSKLVTKALCEAYYGQKIKLFLRYENTVEARIEEDAQLRIIFWLLNHEKTDRKSRVIDLGCGDGKFLIYLGHSKFKNLTGVDYSTNAIQLARIIANDQSMSIKYHIEDLTLSKAPRIGTYNIVHDKGTYDTVSLYPENPDEKLANYLATVAKLLRNKDSLFIITSCNFTEDELISSCENLFVKHCSIPLPKYKIDKNEKVFTSIVFKKRTRNSNRNWFHFCGTPEMENT